MPWNLFIINSKRYEIVVSYANSLSIIKNVIYKLVNSTIVTKTGKKKIKKVAVFPGYLFIESNDENESLVKTMLLEHPYVSKHVGLLNEEDVTHLYKIKDDDSYSKKFTESFVEGDKVKIITGLFKDYEAIVTSVKQKEIFIETDLNGKKVKYAAKPGEISLLQRNMI